VQITDPAIVAAATLSHRYIADRQLPDKAIDLIDEAASSIRMQIDSKPEELDRLDRRIIQLKLEQQALKKESDEASKKRLDMLNEELDDKERQYSELEEEWKARKRHFLALRRLKLNWSRQKLPLNRRAVSATWRGCLSCSTAKFLSWKNSWSCHAVGRQNDASVT
jgi:ATP-dependent Clp protease ATP-binding subunit ClpB